MQFGFVLPRGDARTAADLAHLAEAAGWDGFFVWDPVWGIDPWVALTAAAMRTERIRLGTLLTPLSRHRPWKLAGETAALDNLSGGRVILSVGLGALDTGFAEFGEETDRKVRAELLDEGLAILDGLWRGQPFNFQGQHYQVKATTRKDLDPPPPVQKPRIPVWVVGAWPRPKSMRRVLQWDGLLPNVMDEAGQHVQMKPDHVRAMKAYVDERRAATTPFDIVAEGVTPAGDPAAAADKVHPWAEAGATWWIEALWEVPGRADWEARLTAGPPRID